MYGKLTVITGGMFSGKTGELLQYIKEKELYCQNTVLAIKPDIDKRFSENELVSRLGTSHEAVNLSTTLPEEEVENLLAMVEKYDIVAIDEVQFFNKKIIGIVNKILKTGCEVVVAGLNLDCKGNPFGATGDFMLMADEVIIKKAYCSVCGQPAIFSQKLQSSDTDIIDIGDNEKYTPRCREHFCP